jgi:DNA-binding transcriptional LysR family regulator
MTQPKLPFRDLDSGLFKAFLYAARELNFTRAAGLAGMTQSGVSQKIAKLEAELGRSLFARVNKSLSLTEAGIRLLDYIEKQQGDLAQLFESLGEGSRSLAGPVRYAMPHSCLFTPHFPLLLKARMDFSEVSLTVDLCPNEEVVAKVLDRSIDFGFITKESGNPALEHVPFAQEEYGLVGRRETKLPLAAVADLPFVDYPGMRALFEIWRQVALPTRRRLTFDSLNIQGRINSLHGAVTMLTHDVGWTVLPLHVVEEELRTGELYHLRVPKKTVQSEIHMITLNSIRQPERVRAVMHAFHEMK